MLQAEDVEIVRSRKEKCTFLNVAASFDIETTSTKVNGDKAAFVFCWQFLLGDVFIMGRDLSEFVRFVDLLSEVYGLSKFKRLPVYVHNMSFEFQFMRKLFAWEEVFSLEEREPVRALTAQGVEFRCSYILSGRSLESLGKSLTKFPCEKLKGDLDYRLVRTPETPLTDAEIGYCKNDVQIVVNYIREKIEADGDVTKIPLTKTGYVRNACRKACFPTDKARRSDAWQYRKLMQNLTIDAEEYAQLKRAFQGGFTHANALYVGETLNNLKSYDFTSSYPAQMVAGYFPMSKSRKVEVTDGKNFVELIKNYCCLFDVRFDHIEAKIPQEDYLSESRCSCKNAEVNNGRIVTADDLCTTMTEIDWQIFRRCYTFSGMRVSNFRIYRRGRLPRPIVETTLRLYEQKTTLKDVEGKEIDYALSKEMINSMFGMMVTDVLRDEIVYSGDGWSSEHPDPAEAIARYNASKKRFLFYPWGVWITAHARRALWSAILSLGMDYVYSDTDSVKVLNADAHEEYFKQYDEIITEKLEETCRAYRLPISMIRPKTIRGEEKPLGVWSDEGKIDRFKTLGAKRYMTEKAGNVSITVAGLGKKVGRLLTEKAERIGKDVFDLFVDGMSVDGVDTDKLTHTYLDDPVTAEITDYMGRKCVIDAPSSVHLEPAPYMLSLAKTFINYLKRIERRNE